MNVFKVNSVQNLLDRINKLTPETKALWGTMDAAKMLAHCNVTYEMAYENKHPKPNAIMRFILKTCIKNTVVSSTVYKKN